MCWVSFGRRFEKWKVDGSGHQEMLEKVYFEAVAMYSCYFLKKSCASIFDLLRLLATRYSLLPSKSSRTDILQSRLFHLQKPPNPLIHPSFTLYLGHFFVKDGFCPSPLGVLYDLRGNIGSSFSIPCRICIYRSRSDAKRSSRSGFASRQAGTLHSAHDGASPFFYGPGITTSIRENKADGQTLPLRTYYGNIRNTLGLPARDTGSFKNRH